MLLMLFKNHESPFWDAVSVLYILNQLARKKNIKNTEDLDDNDAVASFSDVQTAGILLAQRYIRTSLIRLIICLLGTILFAAGNNDVIWKGSFLQFNTFENIH